MNARYRCKSGEENALSFGEAGWPTLLVLQPLFEEANRTRQVLASAMRVLARDHGIASVLPDLPGTGDSLLATRDARWEDWRDAVGSAAAQFQPAMTLAVRGGALLDGFAGDVPAWRLAPETGARLLRDMVRASAMSGGSSPSELTKAAQERPARLAGNLIDPALFRALDAAVPDAGNNRPVRTVRLGEGPDPADLRADGVAVWRRAEPTRDPALVDIIVGDLIFWMSACGIR